MSPEPYVRAQAYVLLLAFALSAILGSAEATTASVAVAWLFQRTLRTKYRRDVLRHRETAPPHRERLDEIVDGDARAVFLTASAISVLSLREATPWVDTAVPPISFVFLIIAAAGVYLSSLVDWYLILPRLTGQLGGRPCRSPDHRFESYPHSWRELTRAWYLHRIVSALAFRYGLSSAISFGVADVLTFPLESAAISALALGWLATYVIALPRAVWQAGKLHAIVGQTLVRRDVEQVPRFTVRLGKRTRAIPWFRRRVFGARGEREYVYDVSVEGVGFVKAMSREGAQSSSSSTFEGHPTTVELRDLRGLESSDRSFSGCQSNHCSGISWYCIENPRCFEPK